MKNSISLLSRAALAVATVSCLAAVPVNGQDAPAPAAAAEKPAAAAPADAPAAPAAAPAPSGPVATVNGEKISPDELLERFRMVVSRQLGPQAAQIPPGKFAEILATLPPEQKKELVDELIDEKLLAQAAAKAKIEVPAEKLDEQIKQIPVPPQMDLDGFLKAQGLSEKEVRADFKRGLSIQMLIEKQTEGKVADPSGEDIQKFYDDNPQFFEVPASVKARHILIKTEGPETEAAAKTKIDGIRKRVTGEKAEDFAKVAMETSEGPSGPRGGDLGQFGPGQMVPEFDKTVFAMKVGDISEPVKTQFGYHIIKLDEKNEAGKQPLNDELKEKITGALKAENEQKVIEDYLKKLREDAKIEIG
ncbi:MAG: hypothetical protein HKN23_01255 [Verrucomicrobiales bacterium]|nr:hypothetical protein [Verrucomicrobiales bacterium]